jgi:sterol desaturase/sphingolipid hydroxylase (fatty acid hydroxylase superfamily)
METYQPGLIGSIALAAIFLYGLIELLWLTVLRKQVSFRHEYSQVLKNLVVVFGVSSFLPVLTTMGLALAGRELAAFSLGHDWYIWPFAFLLYEFWYWVHHFLAHKVRLLWCVHAPHHAPDTINMVVGYNHHMLEVPYMAFFLGFVPALCGVPLEMILVFSIADMCWGSMLHASPKVISRRYGPLEYILQTPSYHRAHHAQNPLYMDTNYNSMTLFWDYLLATRQVLDDKEPVVFGITRDVDVESWRDVQFGEFKLLWYDVREAPGYLNKLAYLFMPPGWSHTGDHKMASTQKQNLAAQAHLYRVDS